MPALLLASLVIPVCSATFPDVIGSSDSRLEQCFDQLGIGKLDWSLPLTPHASSLSMRYRVEMKLAIAVRVAGHHVPPILSTGGLAAPPRTSSPAHRSTPS